MLAILGAVIGLLGSLAPEVLKYFKAKQDQKHELAVLNVQAEMAKQGHQYRMEEINVQADIASEQAVYKAAEVKPTGVKICDALLAFYNGTVRPTIAYAYFAMYAFVKYAMYKLLVARGIGEYQAIVALWNDNDMAVFSTIMSFYYGGRFMKYALDQFGTSVPQILDKLTNNNKHSQPALVPVAEPPASHVKPPTDDTAGIKPNTVF